MSAAAQQKVLVIGCGALGGALIGRINASTELSVLDPSPRAKIQKNIFFSAADLHGQSFDAIIVATKCYAIDDALIPLKEHVSTLRILFLQNGILNLTKVKRAFPKASIVRGVTTSAVGISSGKAVFHYKGEFFFAPESGQGDGAAAWFARLFADAGLKTVVVSNAARIVWAKLIFSAVMNPLPVMTGQGYDILKVDGKIWMLVQEAVEEGRAVARALGIRLAFDPLKLILRVRNGDLAGIVHKGSIVQDISAGRQTELDYITGALIREARRMKIKTPALDEIFLKARSAGA